MFLTAPKRRLLLPVLLTLSVHALAWLVFERASAPAAAKPRTPPALEVLLLPAPAAPEPQVKPAQPPSRPAPAPKALATMAAPPAPSAEDWAFAGRYTLKNSKGYRHNWGRQVRSMMGTATEGPGQGMVRFRIEIAPSGRLSRLETLWSTSPAVEHKARQAIGQMPPLPPTPTGQPLVFEKTIVFSPFARDDTPLYRHDCDPEVPRFRNPFVWNGQSDKMREDDPPPAEPMSPQALADCRKQLPPETVQSEAARDQRVMDRWGSAKSGHPSASD